MFVLQSNKYINNFILESNKNVNFFSVVAFWMKINIRFILSILSGSKLNWRHMTNTFILCYLFAKNNDFQV